MSGVQDSQRPGLEGPELALLAHEIRGALTVIVGMSELLRRELTPEERARALDGISRAVERMDRLVEDALGGDIAIARPSELIDVAALAEQVAAEQTAVTGRQVEVDAETHPKVAGSRQSLERALSNLIENGLKYSLGSAPVEVTVSEGPGIAILRVADRGPGIGAEDRERMFEPFERVGGSSVSGTGLGLTVVRSVAEAHGGRVTYEERAGGGSVFSLELPV